MPAYFMVCPLKVMQNFGSGLPLSGVKLIVLLIFVRLIPDTFSSARASLVGQLVKNPPAMQESWVRSLGWEDPLEKEMATHSSTLAWRIHGQRSGTGCSPWNCRVRHNKKETKLVFLHEALTLVIDSGILEPQSNHDSATY